MPQVSALASKLLQAHVDRFDFLGRLETFRSDWARIQDIIAEWPEYDARLSEQAHPKTNQNSSNPDRAAMAALLAPVPPTRLNAISPQRIALCRVLLPDYVCLGYRLPDDCKLIIGQHEVSCPISAWLPSASVSALVLAEAVKPPAPPGPPPPHKVDKRGSI